MVANHPPYQMPHGWMDHPAIACAREVFDRRSAFVWLVENANFAPGEKTFGGITHQLKTGELVASISYMAKAWMWDACRVRRFLNRLSADRLIEVRSTREATYVTICNYSENHATRHTNRHTPKTVADTGVRHNRRQTEESKTLNNVPAYSDSPEGVQGEERNGHRHPREWSPKVNHPNQLDLISNTALAADYAAVPAPADPEPELPVGLSLEGEVLPPEAPEPEGLPPAVGELELIPAPPAKPSNVVRLKPETDPDFRQWYETYPRHKKPLDAAKAYAEARRRASASELLEGARRCREEATGKDKRFVAYPASWLRAGGWMEEAEPESHAFGSAYHGQHYDHREERGPNALPNALANILARRARNAGASGV